MISSEIGFALPLHLRWLFFLSTFRRTKTISREIKTLNKVHLALITVWEKKCCSFQLNRFLIPNISPLRSIRFERKTDTFSSSDGFLFVYDCRELENRNEIGHWRISAHCVSTCLFYSFFLFLSPFCNIFFLIICNMNHVSDSTTEC